MLNDEEKLIPLRKVHELEEATVKTRSANEQIMKENEDLRSQEDAEVYVYVREGASDGRRKGRVRLWGSEVFGTGGVQEECWEGTESLWGWEEDRDEKRWRASVSGRIDDENDELYAKDDWEGRRKERRCWWGWSRKERPDWPTKASGLERGVSTVGSGWLDDPGGAHHGWSDNFVSRVVEQAGGGS